MNTGKQINAMVIVLFLTLIAVGIYTIWEPFRADVVEDQQTAEASERAATTFALNCRLCHGDRGEGGLMGGRLPAAPPLDVARFQMDDEAVFNLLSDTISCGRIGTAMPAWSRSQGGTLNEEQIRQLVVLITEGEWHLAQEHADELDAETADHALIDMPGGLSADATEIFVDDADPFSLGQYLRIGSERLRVRQNEIIVTRGLLDSDPAEHEPGAELVRVDTEVTLDDDEVPDSLREAMTDETDAIGVSDLDNYTVGDLIQIDDELLRVEGFITGLSTTGLRTAEEIGREPDEVMISATGDLEVGDVVRIDGELVELVAIGDAPNGSVLGADLSRGGGEIDVTDPAFFGENYVLLIGDERIEILEPVTTGHVLFDRVGRAETTLFITGTNGIEPGDTLRLGSELVRVTEVLEEARITVERGAGETTAASHNSGTAFFVPAEESGDEDAPVPAPESTDQELIEGVGAEDTTLVVTGTTGLSVGETYVLGSNELVEVVESFPARIKVERGVEDTDAAVHPRRDLVHVGRLFEVERGVDGTSAAAHSAGDVVRLTQLTIDRAVQGSELQDHARNEEIFLGHSIVVSRGVLGTEPAEHENGEEVRDHPAPPDAPAINEQACGQAALAASDPGPTPAAGDQLVDISLLEWQVNPDPPALVEGRVSFNASNVGGTIHNFRVLRTELAADALPIVASAVDEESSDLEVVGESGTIQVGASEFVPADLTAGNYVLICNIPGHYQNGMRTAFEVAAP